MDVFSDAFMDDILFSVYYSDFSKFSRITLLPKPG